MLANMGLGRGCACICGMQMCEAAVQLSVIHATSDFGRPPFSLGVAEGSRLASLSHVGLHAGDEPPALSFRVANFFGVSH